jgi:membrane protein YdbS with pleckstrin-like domain
VRLVDGDSLGMAGPVTLPAQPTAGEEEVFPLHPRARALWVVQTAVAATLGAVPALGAFLLSGRWLAALAVPFAAVAVVIAASVYGRAFLRRFRCRLLHDGLLIERGVWWRSETFVPRARIQHTDVEEGPLQRRLGMATLEVYTAGTHASRLAVHSLSREAALTLRDRLLGRGGSDAV